MRYKNISDREQFLDGVGVVQAEEEFDTKLVIENPNFEKVNKDVIKNKKDK